MGLNLVNQALEKEENNHSMNLIDYMRQIIKDLENSVKDKDEQIGDLEENNEALIEELELSREK